jgi:hypothetical protein
MGLADLTGAAGLTGAAVLTGLCTVGLAACALCATGFAAGFAAAFFFTACFAGAAFLAAFFAFGAGAGLRAGLAAFCGLRALAALAFFAGLAFGACWFFLRGRRGFTFRVRHALHHSISAVACYSLSCPLRQPFAPQKCQADPIAAAGSRAELGPFKVNCDSIGDPAPSYVRGHLSVRVIFPPLNHP